MKQLQTLKKQAGIIPMLAGSLLSTTGSAGGVMGALGGLGGMFSNVMKNPLVSGLGAMFGLGQTQKGLNQARDDVLGLPGMGGPSNIAGNFGMSADGNFVMDPGMQAMQSALTSGGLGMLGGGLFNTNPMLGAAMSGMDFAGAVDDPAFAARMGDSAFGGLEGLFNNASGTADMLQGRFAGGPQDLTGGLMGQMFGAGLGNLTAAGDTSQLRADQLATLRELGAPAMQRQSNVLMDKLHAMGMLGSTGGAAQMEGLLNAQNQADLGFQNTAFGLAQQEANRLGNLGMGQMGVGQQMLGQNLNQFNQDIGNFGTMSQLASGLEGQGFGQQLQGMNFNTSQGMNRLNSMMGLFGMGNDVFQNNIASGLGMGNLGLGFGEFGMNAAAMPFQLQAALLSGGGQHADALANVGAALSKNSGNFFSGMFG
jgi:hypothetical protein